MKLELLDTYHIRVRLSASIIVLAPVAITIFLCFQEIATVASSSILIAVLLSFTNYLPIVQRQIYQKSFRSKIMQHNSSCQMMKLSVQPPKNGTIKNLQRLTKHLLSFKILIPAKAFISAVRAPFDI